MRTFKTSLHLYEQCSAAINTPFHWELSLGHKYFIKLLKPHPIQMYTGLHCCDAPLRFGEGRAKFRYITIVERGEVLRRLCITKLFSWLVYKKMCPNGSHWERGELSIDTSEEVGVRLCWQINLPNAMKSQITIE